MLEKHLLPQESEKNYSTYEEVTKMVEKILGKKIAETTDEKMLAKQYMDEVKLAKDTLLKK